MSHCEAQIAHYWCGLGNNAIIVFDFGLNIYVGESIDYREILILPSEY